MTVPAITTSAHFTTYGSAAPAVIESRLSFDLPPSLPLIGVNKGGWQAVTTALGRPLPAYRGYCYATHPWPKTYPGPDAGPIPGGVTMPEVSLAVPLVNGQQDINGLIGGKYDDGLASFFASLTPDAMITVGAELDGERFPFTSTQIKAMHQHVAAIFRDIAPPGARYGQCFAYYTGQPVSRHYPMSNWVATGLDFYALDAYNAPPPQALGDCFDQIRQAVTDPVLTVWEANSRETVSRAQWLLDAIGVARDYGCLAFTTYWDAADYKFNPDDVATLKVLLSADTWR